jgi:hypothetical protein
MVGLLEHRISTALPKTLELFPGQTRSGVFDHLRRRLKQVAVFVYELLTNY